ncbi:GIP, partial [Symbiodinium microadriaticum]
FILNKKVCDEKYAGLFSYSYVSAWITLTVHSSLEAVGLTAAFASALAREGISANVVAAFFHDHVFVDIKDAERAVATLQKMSKDAQGPSA